ncbi:MAG: prolyl oligopeptidase family serine peptidase [Planctomycetales bacterium]
MKLLALLGLMLAVTALSIVMVRADERPAPGKQVPQRLDRDGETIHYLLFLPKDYENSEKERKWPLMLFLHGAGERGDGNLELVKVHGPPKIVETKPDFPFLLVSPQCPEGEGWDAATLQALLDHVESQFPVDRDRVCVTGLSMGGYGTWALLAAQPRRFAAAVPICGGGNVADAEKLKEVPVRVYHGDQDRAVPVARSREMVEALKQAGGKVEYTEYQNIGHDSWTQTYADEKLYEWLLKQTRKTSE